MQHRYEPWRIQRLSRQSASALRALDAITCSDPAAANALSAMAGLRSVIVDEFIPATATITDIDPLGQPTSVNALGGVSDLWERWFSTDVETNPYSTFTDEELITALRDLGDAAPFEAQADPHHPYWDDFQDLADELALRSTDPTTGDVTFFGQWLLDTAFLLPALPIAFSKADFDPHFGVELIEAIFDPEVPFDGGMHRLEAFGVDLILLELEGHPEVIAQLFVSDYDAVFDGTKDIESTAFHQLLTSDVVNHQLLMESIAAVFDLSSPVPMALVEKSMAMFVMAANSSEFERGFPPLMSQTLTVALIDLLPSLSGQIRLNEPVYFDDLPGADAILMGGYSDVRDLVGALLLDPAGLALLLALGDSATGIAAEATSPLDVQAFGELLREAFEENLGEVDIANARTRAQWAFVTGAMGTLLGVGTVAAKLGPVGVKLGQALIERLGSEGADASEEARPPDDVGYLAQVMIRIGSYEGFLDRYEADGGAGSGPARKMLEDAWEQFEADVPLGRMAETLQDVAEEIIGLGGTDFIEGDVTAAVVGIDPLTDDPDL